MEREEQKIRYAWIVVAILGFMSVLFGAFGAHGLKAWLSADMLAVWQTAVLYQMIHGLGMLGVAALAPEGSVATVTAEEAAVLPVAQVGARRVDLERVATITMRTQERHDQGHADDEEHCHRKDLQGLPDLQTRLLRGPLPVDVSYPGPPEISTVSPNRLRMAPHTSAYRPGELRYTPWCFSTSRANGATTRVG